MARWYRVEIDDDDGVPRFAQNFETRSEAQYAFDHYCDRFTARVRLVGKRGKILASSNSIGGWEQDRAIREGKHHAL